MTTRPPCSWMQRMVSSGVMPRGTSSLRKRPIISPSAVFTSSPTMALRPPAGPPAPAAEPRGPPPALPRQLLDDEGALDLVGVRDGDAVDALAQAALDERARADDGVAGGVLMAVGGGA